MKKIISKISYILFIAYLLALFLYSYNNDTNYISNILMAIVIFFLMVNIVIKGKLEFNKFILYYSFYIVLSLIMLPISIDISHSLDQFLKITILFVFNVGVYNLIISDKNKIRMVFLSIFYIGVISSLIIFVNSDLSNIRRFGSILGNVNIVGFLLTTSFGIGLSMLLDNQIKKYNYVFLFIILFASLLTGSRKVIIYLTVTLSLIFIPKFKKKINFKNFIKLTTIFFVIFILIYVISNNEIISEVLFKRILALFDFFKDNNSGDGSVLIRSEMISLGFDFFKERPLFGSGLNTYMLKYGSLGNEPTYSHNNYVEILSNQGLIGFIVFHLSIGSLFLSTIKKAIYTNKHVDYFYLAFIVSLLINAIALVYYDEKFILLIMVLISAAVQMKKPVNIN